MSTITSDPLSSKSKDHGESNSPSTQNVTENKPDDLTTSEFVESGDSIVQSTNQDTSNSRVGNIPTKLYQTIPNYTNI